jgi:hypothetical protein
MPGKRGVKFKDSKVEAMLDSIEHVMPIAQSEWDAVASLHDKCFPQQARTVELLCLKIQEFFHKTSSTGDPNCSTYVCCEKLIN